jgi:hypothetical protein
MLSFIDDNCGSIQGGRAIAETRISWLTPMNRLLHRGLKPFFSKLIEEKAVLLQMKITPLENRGVEYWYGAASRGWLLKLPLKLN